MATPGQLRTRTQWHSHTHRWMGWLKFVTLIAGLAIAWPLASYAQQPKGPLKRVGVLASQVPCPLQPDNPVVRGLGELGWVEGQNFLFECVSAVGRIDQVPALARELVSRRPDVLMASPIHFVNALKRETTTIPIVMLVTWDPVRVGLITNLALPGGNVTGVARFGLLPKQMELLREIVPNLRRAAYITGVVGDAYTPPEAFTMLNDDRQSAAKAFGFTWQVFTAAAANDYVSEAPGWAKNCGLLLSYGQDLPWSVARAMNYVDKILRGAKPSDLPVQQATKLQLVINLKTAKTLGLAVPPSLIARADEVIE